VGGAPLNQNQPLQVFHDGNGLNQRWGLYDAGAAPFGIDAIPRILVFRAYEVDEFVLAWTVPDGSDAAGVQIQLSVIPDNIDYADEAPNQRWFAKEAAFNPDNPVLIRSAWDQSVLDVPGFSTKAGAIQHFENKSGLNQIWTLEDFDNDGRYVIRSLSSNLVLDVPADANNPPKQVTNIQQFPSHGGENQRWRLVDAGAGRVRIESVFSPGFVLDAKIQDDDDLSMQVFPWHDGENQKWELIPGYWDEFASPTDKFRIFDA
jgi:hypothetical protein